MPQREYEIEKGVAMPSEPTKRIYPFSLMEIGDSFYVPSEGKKILSVRSNAYAYASKHGMKFSCRLENGGIRVWRVK